MLWASNNNTIPPQKKSPTPEKVAQTIYEDMIISSYEKYGAGILYKNSQNPTKKTPCKRVFFRWRREEDLNLRIRSRITRFPIVLLKPLRHLCIVGTAFATLIYITVFFEKMQAFSPRFFKISKKSFKRACRQAKQNGSTLVATARGAAFQKPGIRAFLASELGQ